MKKIAIVVLILLVLTAITKPSEDSFNEYIRTELKSNSKDGILVKIAKGLSGIQSSLTTKYDDKTFFSTVESTVGGERHKYLGILGMWFEIE